MCLVCVFSFSEWQSSGSTRWPFSQHQPGFGMTHSRRAGARWEQKAGVGGPAHETFRSILGDAFPSGRQLPSGSDGKESACNAGDPGLIPGLRRSPGEGYGNPLQYSCLENSMNRGAWQATVHGVTKSWTQLSN